MSILLPLIFLASTPEQQVEEFAKNLSKKAIELSKTQTSQKLFPKNDKSFDADTAKSNLLKGQIPLTDTRKFINDLPQSRYEDLNLLDLGDKITKNLETKIEVLDTSNQNFTVKKCQESLDPYPITLNRSLHVEIKHTSAIIKKECQGHTISEIIKHGDIRKTVKNKKNQLKKNKNIFIYSTNTYLKDKDNSYTIKYKHTQEDPTCNNYKKHIIQKETWEEVKDTWQPDNQKLFTLSQTPDCTLHFRKCIDQAPEKIIDGKLVQRKCWKEKLSYLCYHPEQKGCSSLRAQKCQQLKKTCLKEAPNGCALWEKTFKCFSNPKTKILPPSGSETFLSPQEITYEENHSLPEVATKLTIFREMKKDLENTQALDATKAHIFKGNCYECHKNILENTMYDCCFSLKGLANKLGLSKCSPEELALAERREQGHCHYIGFYSEKLLDILWKSRDTHVYCCFPSKLARILQQEARKQLKLTWGTPECPDCRGLTSQEIAKLDFSLIDLSEAYEDQMKNISSNPNKKLESFKIKLKDIENKMRKTEGGSHESINY